MHAGLTGGAVGPWKALASALLLAAVAAGPGRALAAEFDIDVAQLQEITPPPGTVINAGNLDRFRMLLDPDLAGLVKSGLVEFTVGPTTSFKPHAAYINATAQYGGRAQLGTPGVLENYTAGRPFPGPPSTRDPRIGEKIAWNMRLMYIGDSGRTTEMHWQLRNMKSGKIERDLEFDFRSIRFMFRHVVPPVPFLKKNPANAFAAFYLRAIEAADMTDVEILGFVSSEDVKGIRGWVYIPQLERTQSLESFSTRETMFGSDIVSDDLFGYTGRIVDMAWRFVGETYVLLPMYRHDQAVVTERKARRSDYRFVYYHGQGGCFPQIPWQLRHAYIVEGIPTVADYPVSKRIMYVDAQTYYPSLIKMYDRSDDLWKLSIIGLAHPNSHDVRNNETGAPIIDSASMIDLIKQRCTTMQLRFLINVDDLDASDFNPSDLGGAGRGRGRGRRR